MTFSRRLLKMLIELAVLSRLSKLFHILGRKAAGNWSTKEFLDLDDLYPRVRFGSAKSINIPEKEGGKML